MKDLNVLQRHFLWVAEHRENFTGIVLAMLVIVLTALGFTVPVLWGLSSKVLLILPAIILSYMILYSTVRSLFITVNKTYANDWLPYEHLILILKDGTSVFVRGAFWGKGRCVYVSGLDSKEIDIEVYLSYLRGDMKYEIQVRFEVVMKNKLPSPKILYQDLLDTHRSFDDGDTVSFSEFMGQIVIDEVQKQKSAFDQYLDKYLSREITEKELIDKVWREVTFPKYRFDTIDNVTVYCDELEVSRQI